jgi:hypothetical protein
MHKHKQLTHTHLYICVCVCVCMYVHHSTINHIFLYLGAISNKLERLSLADSIRVIFAN